MAKNTADAVVRAEATGQQPKVVRANLERRMEESQNYVSLYANDAQIQMTPWDLRIILGQISSTPSPGDPTMLVRLIGDVRMSPQLAKKVTQILLGQIQLYERTIGPIAIPED